MRFKKLTVRDVPLDNQTVLVRVDYNVPLNEKGQIDDDFRIRSSIDTIEYLLDRGCKVVLISHLGRPEGNDPRCSLEPTAQRLAELLGRPVRFVDQTIGDKPLQAVRRAPKNSVIMLENLRFHPEEEQNSAGFARQLKIASGASYFVQDGFGVVHRAHASTDAITHQIPSVAGLLLEREYVSLRAAIDHPKRPLVAILGGAKVSDKIQLVDEFIEKADRVLIGGAMANTFLAALGDSMGKSRVEPGQEKTVRHLKALAAKKSDLLFELPADIAVATTLEGARRSVPIGQIKPDELALDIGDETIERYVEAVRSAGTVIWNGTLGVAEKEAFAHGSARIALELATHPEIVSIIGGGDTADFVLHWDGKQGKSFTHVSTGGGASLELMAGEKLPGIESLLGATK